MMKAFSICAAALAIASMPVQAEKHDYKGKHVLGLYHGLYTDHVFQPDDEDDLNEDNEVWVLQYNRWNIGTFENSHYNRSHALAWEFYGGRYSHKNLYIDGRFAVGGATGYVGDAPTVLGIVPSVLLSTDVGMQHEHFEYGVRAYYTIPNVVNAGLFFNVKF